MEAELVESQRSVLRTLGQRCSPVLRKRFGKMHEQVTSESCRRVLRVDHSAPLQITSAPTRTLVRAAKRGFRNTPLSDQADWRREILLYHEISLDARYNSSVQPTAMDALTQSLTRTGACAMDLFLAMPELVALLQSDASCIASFYRLAGACEPFAGCRTLPRGTGPGFILVRKVAAMYHASTSVAPGRSLLWLDFDVVPRRAPDAQFWSFVASSDITYLPFTSRDRERGRVEAYADAARHGREQPLHSLADLLRFPVAWSVDTGVLGLVVSARTRELLWRLLRHYDGGAAALAAHCLVASSSVTAALAPAKVRAGHGRRLRQQDDAIPCDALWLRDNLYLDDLYVWNLHVSASLRRWSNTLIGLRPSTVPISHGWFGVGTPDGTTGHCRQEPSTPAYLVTVCPNSTESALVSRFDLFGVFQHLIGRRGPYAALPRAQPNASALGHGQAMNFGQRIARAYRNARRVVDVKLVLK